MDAGDLRNLDVGVVVAEVAPARAQCRQVVGHFLEVTEGLITAGVVGGDGHLAVAGSLEGHVGRGVDQGAPDQELALHEALVHAEVTSVRPRDLRLVVEDAVAAALGVLNVLLLRVDDVADVLVDVHLLDTPPLGGAHAAVPVVARGLVSVCTESRFVEALGGNVDEVEKLCSSIFLRLAVVPQNSKVFLDVLVWIGLVDLIANEAVVKGLRCSHGVCVAVG